MSKSFKLVLSGSGTLYPAHVGAIIRLSEEGYVFDEVVGTSGGSIVAAALASGYKPNSELVELIKKTLPAKNKLVDPSIFALITRWGFIKGDRIEATLNKYMVKKFKDTRIPLHVVTCNIERRQMRVFSSKSDPEMDVSFAIKASMSIPGVFVPVKLDGELYVDGGLAGNFLIDYFGDDVPTIGIKFKGARGSYKKINSPFDYTGAVIDTMLEANTEEHIEDTPSHGIIVINSKHSTLEFNMTEKDAMDLIHEGYTAADQWIKGRR